MKLKKYITSLLVAGIVVTSTSLSSAMDNNSTSQDLTSSTNLSIQEIEDNKVNLTDSVQVDDELKSIEEQQKDWDELDERIKAGDKDLFPTAQDIKDKGITEKASYPTRKGVILVTKAFGVTSLTGHAGIVYSDKISVESFPIEFSPKGVEGVYLYPNDWNTRYSSAYAVTVTGVTPDQDKVAADYSFRRYEERKPYNWIFTDIENGAKFYCSQLVYKAFKVMNGVDINHNGGIVYPMDLVNSSKTYVLWSK